MLCFYKMYYVYYCHFCARKYNNANQYSQQKVSDKMGLATGISFVVKKDKSMIWRVGLVTMYGLFYAD
jgi:hypothetical protein